MVLCSPSQALDIEVVINVDVVRGAVAAAGATAKGKCRHQVVVNPAQSTDRPRRIHDDSPGVNYLAELSDDLSLREKITAVCPDPPHDSRPRTPSAPRWRTWLDKPQAPGTVFRPIADASAHACNWRDQQLCIRLHRQSDETRDIGGFLSDRHGLHASRLRIDDRSREQRGLSFIADVRA